MGSFNEWFIVGLPMAKHFGWLTQGRSHQYTFLTFPVEKGPLTSLYVGTSSETKDANGRWFIPFARESPHYGFTKNPEIEARLWNWIEEKRKGHY